MKQAKLDTAESLAIQMRQKLNMDSTSPIDLNVALRILNIQTIFKQLSDDLFGLSLQSADKHHKFMMINCNNTVGGQRFTIAHELFHLFYDADPQVHLCYQDMYVEPSERSANLFASALLMPKDGLLQYIPSGEIISQNISIDTVLKLEQLYGVSHKTLVIRLKELGLITNGVADNLRSISVCAEAKFRGYPCFLYQPGNENLIISDYGSIAKKLLDGDKISEGHYLELMKAIGYGEGENSFGC